jgi:hypothetical protein
MRMFSREAALCHNRLDLSMQALPAQGGYIQGGLG